MKNEKKENMIAKQMAKRTLMNKILKSKFEQFFCLKYQKCHDKNFIKKNEPRSALNLVRLRCSPHHAQNDQHTNEALLVSAQKQFVNKKFRIRSRWKHVESKQ